MKVNKVLVGTGIVAGIVTIVAGVKVLCHKNNVHVEIIDDGLELDDVFTNAADMLIELPASLVYALNEAKGELYNNVGRMHYEYYDTVKEVAYFAEIAFGSEVAVKLNADGKIIYNVGGSDV